MSNLPTGQREADRFHRFGLTQFAKRFPKQIATPTLEVVGKVAHELHLSNALDGLPRTERISDFHCVTTWSVRQLRWSGVRFADFYQSIVLPLAGPDPGATLVALRGQDGASTGMLLKDLLADDVLLADRLDDQPCWRSLKTDHLCSLKIDQG